MKKQELFILLVIASLIVGLLVYSVDFSTYDSIASARNKPGRFVHLIVRVDTAAGITYDPLIDPNHLSFYVVDSLNARTLVVYKNSKPAELEKSERVVLKGYMKESYFECKDILLKCPSKYKASPGLTVSNGKEQPEYPDFNDNL